MKRAFTIWQFLLLVVPLFLIAAIMYPVTIRARENKKWGCPDSLKTIGLAVNQYVQDYNGKYPAVSSGGEAFGWADALQPYIKSTQVFQCPSDQGAPPPGPVLRARGYTDYWLNSKLIGRSTNVLIDAGRTILNGDGNDGRHVADARYALGAIPEVWKQDSSSPLYRHWGGANYSFADGHVKWFKAGEMAAMNPNASPNKGLPTFALK